MMTTTISLLRRKIAYLLHWGCVEIRSLAEESGHDAAIADLADVLEYLPRHMLDEPSEDDWDVITSMIAGYAARNPAVESRLVDILNQDPPDRY